MTAQSCSTLRKLAEETFPCDRCGRHFRIGLLDPVLLDDGVDATAEFFCRVCHPHECLALRVRDNWVPASWERPMPWERTAE